MSDPTLCILDDALRERAEALPPADFAPERIMRTARRRQRTHRTYALLGGVAAATVVVTLALQSGQVSTAPPLPAGTSNRLDTALTIDQIARANASHAFATSLPKGPPQVRDIGYDVVSRGQVAAGVEQIAVLLPRGEARLFPGVRAVSSPTRVADGWVFIGHTSDPDREWAVSPIGSTVIHVRDDLTVRALADAEAVASIFPSPDGRKVAAVTGTRTGAEVQYESVRFVTLASKDTVEVELPGPDASAVATWERDRVTFVEQEGRSSSRFHVYDLTAGRWFVEHVSGVNGGDLTMSLLAAPAAQGGRPNQSLVVLRGADGEVCAHFMIASTISPEQLVCSTDPVELRAGVSPGGRYAVVGAGWNGRINTGPAARVIDLATGRDLPGLPERLLDVGAFYLIWENDHSLIGQATRATPVHDSAALFRWDLATSSGESLDWDPSSGPQPRYPSSELVPPIL